MCDAFVLGMLAIVSMSVELKQPELFHVYWWIALVFNGIALLKGK